eukprot:5556383-Pleurochrysis_carterae.AAC.1
MEAGPIGGGQTGECGAGVARAEAGTARRIRAHAAGGGRRGRRLAPCRRVAAVAARGTCGGG